MSIAKRLSIRSKLLAIILGTTGTALIVGFTAVASYVVVSLRSEMIDRTALTAQVVAEYSASELAFKDPTQATQTLANLAALPEIESAYLFDLEWKLFASYERIGSDDPMPPFQNPGSSIDRNLIHVVQPVVMAGEELGTLYVRCSTERLQSKVVRYLLVTCLLLGLLMAAAAAAALRLEKVISRPILKLASAANAVSESGDYSSRVTKEADDEIGTLFSAWNEMLLRIEKRRQKQERAESALRRSEERFRNLIEQSRDAVYVMSAESRFVYINPRFEEMLGYTIEEVTAPIFSSIDLVAEEHRETVQAYRRRLAEHGSGVERLEFGCITRNGVIVEIEANITNIEWDGKPARMGVMRDISARKRAERRLKAQQAQLEDYTAKLERYAHDLERRNRELDQFAYVVSHDLKAPLRAITNLSTWIEEDLGSTLDPEVSSNIELMRQRVHRMDNLIDGILEYSRVGRVHTGVEDVDTDSLLAEVIGDIAIPKEFSVEISGEMPTLSASRIRLAQVFSNLISNAVNHHDRKEGRIWISASEDDDSYVFAVRDDGPGIAPEYQEKVFMIFQTLKPRDHHESTGVGLAIVKKIVEESNGTLSLISSSGRGSTFRFTWPKSPAQDEPESSATHEELVVQ
ncbi:MAG: PAS domain S-box protein [bacterium]|nr:PAS domain S-box protein [bacterium]